MRHTCTNCNHLSSYGGAEVSCKQVGRFQSADAFAYVKQENDCLDFDARLIDINSHGDNRKSLFSLLDHLMNSPIVGESMRAFVQVPSSTHFWTGRGVAMLELSDNDLPSFEGDYEFKLYDDISNHVFADLLVPLNKQLDNPIIFWLSRSHPSGVIHVPVSSSVFSYHVIKLGNPYSFESICRSLAEALRIENVKIQNPWFSQFCKKQFGFELRRLSSACSYVFNENNIEDSL